MPFTTSRILSLISLCLLAVLLTACASSGPAALQPGTPGFFWAAAKQAYQSGDYTRASENLSKLTTTDNEFKPRAEALLAVVSTGMVKGYMDFAEAYDNGARANKDNALAFRRQASTARSQAKGVLLQAMESFHDLNGKKDAKISFEFGNPNGTLAEVGNLVKVAKGMLPPASDAQATLNKSIQRGVVWTTAHAVGAGEDSAKAAEILKQSPAEIGREKFLLGMVQTMVEEADLFGPKQLDEPMRLKMLCVEAQEALKQVPASKDTKVLDEKIQKLLKTIKTT